MKKTENYRGIKILIVFVLVFTIYFSYNYATEAVIPNKQYKKISAIDIKDISTIDAIAGDNKRIIINKDSEIYKGIIKIINNTSNFSIKKLEDKIEIEDTNINPNLKPKDDYNLYLFNINTNHKKPLDKISLILFDKRDILGINYNDGNSKSRFYNLDEHSKKDIDKILELLKLK